MQQPTDPPGGRPPYPLITVTDVILPTSQDVPLPLTRRSLYHPHRSTLSESEEFSPEIDLPVTQSYLESPWAQPNALEKLLAWNSDISADCLDAASINISRSEISASYRLSTLKDDSDGTKSEFISAIMCVNLNKAVELFDLLVENPDLVEQRDNRGNFLIHHAVNRGFLRIIDLLVSQGADINQKNSQGQTPLHLAILEQQVASLYHLILLGCNAEIADSRNNQPIHVACEMNDAESLKELVRSAHVNINAAGEFGGTVIHCCCRNNSTECLKLVLTMGADMFKVDAIGRYPIHIAVSSGSMDCLRILFDHENLTGRNSQGNENGVGASFMEQNLINLPDSEGDTALHFAVNSGNMEMIDFCLKHGSDLTVLQHDGCSPIHYAARRGEVTVLSCLLNWNDKEETVPLLSGVNTSGHTPLHLAAMYNHAKITAFLIKRHSPMEVQDNNGWTPLLLAITKCAIASCLTLIQFGADLSAKDLFQRNALQLAIQYGALKDDTLWKRIREHGLHSRLIYEEDECGCTALHYAIKSGGSMLSVTRDLIALGANCRHQNRARETPLHVAAKQGCIATVESLLRTDHGLWSMNTLDSNGCTPLHIAAANAHSHIVALLMAKGSSFRRQAKGRTPLHWAARVGCLETCKIILGASFNIIDARDFKGMTALHYAAEKDHDGVVTYLMNSGAKFSQDGNGFYFTSLAFKKENLKTGRAIIYNERWDEIVELLNHTDQCPVEKVIREIPNLCPIILDRYIKEAGDPRKSSYEVTYDFTVLQPKAELLDKTGRSPLHLLKVMISLQRNELIVHPLCLALLRYKWKKYGLWINLISTTFYVNYLICLTLMVLDHNPMRHTMTQVPNETCYDLVFDTPGERNMQAALSYVIAIAASICQLQNIILMFTEGLKFFKNIINYYSIAVFAVSIAYSVMALSKSTDHLFVEVGAIALYLAWSYFVIHLMRFKFVGIFVVMLFQVAKTLGKSAVVVILIMISCALPFYVLLKVPDGKTYQTMPEEKKLLLSHCFPIYDYIYEREANGTDPFELSPMLSAFQTPQLAILNVLSMSLGDANFVETIIAPLTDGNPLTMHFPEVTLIMFIIFLLFAPMILTNLLVGLAVGDIDTVRKQAAIRLISQTVDWYDRFEGAVPKQIYSYLVSSVWKSKSSLESPSLLDFNHEKSDTDQGATFIQR
nr:transient receptor potential cation channel [Hymenolepis microstoma]